MTNTEDVNASAPPSGSALWNWAPCIMFGMAATMAMVCLRNRDMTAAAGCGIATLNALGWIVDSALRERCERKLQTPNSEIRHGGPETPDNNPEANPPLPASNG